METDFVDFFIPVQKELFLKVEDGELTLNEFSCYVWLLHQADYETGLWRGSAPRLAAALGGQLSEDIFKTTLRGLREKGLLKSFHKPGTKGNYWIAIHKYVIRFGKRAGLLLNALATEDPKKPIYYKPTHP